MTPEQFKQARIKLGLTQEELANKIQVSKQLISFYEMGKVRIMPKRIEKVIDLLKQDSEEKRKKEVELEYLLKN